MDKARDAMVQQQLIRRGVRDTRVLNVMSELPRHQFVPQELKALAYNDNPLPIGHDQTISQPYIVAFMTELLEVEPHHKVLEIGTGSGYQAAVLAELVDEVYSIEIVAPIYEEAKMRLQSLGYQNIHLKLGDGWKGWGEHAPYDRILVTAAPDIIPPILVDQLKEGGRLVVPVGKQRGHQVIKIGVKHNGVIETTDSIPVRFVPLVQEEEKQEEER